MALRHTALAVSAESPTVKPFSLQMGTNQEKSGLKLELNGLCPDSSWPEGLYQGPLYISNTLSAKLVQS